MNGGAIFDPIESDPPPLKFLHKDGDEIGSIGERMGVRVQSFFKLSFSILIFFNFICSFKRHKISRMVFLHLTVQNLIDYKSNIIHIISALVTQDQMLTSYLLEEDNIPSS